MGRRFPYPFAQELGLYTEIPANDDLTRRPYTLGEFGRPCR